MEKKYKLMKANKKIAAASEYTRPDLNVIRVKPQEMIDGINSADDFFNAIHHVEYDESIKSIDLETYLGSFEIWYENDQLYFYFVLDSEKAEKYVRRQTVGYYSGSEIIKKKLGKKKFPTVKPGNAVSMCRFKLKNDPMKPIDRGSSGGSRNEEEPYKPILNEMDSKSGTRFLFQIIFQPLPNKAWEKIIGNTPEDYSGGGDSEEEGDVDYEAHSEISERASEPIFWTEVRLFCVSDTKRKAEKEIKSIVDFIENYYQNGNANQSLITSK